MMLNRRLTGALAWGGLILILGVPSAEMLSGKVDASAGARSVAATDPVQTASIASTRGAVEEFLASGKPMPDYITSGSPTASQPPAKAVPRVLPATGAIAPATSPKPASPVGSPPALQTASIPPVVEPAPAPVPMPASMRPRAAPTYAATPIANPAPVPGPVVAALPAPVVSAPAPVAWPAPEPMQVQNAEAPPILDENEVISREANADPTPVPPASIPNGRVVTEEDLADWDSGSLADYLQRRGLISDAARPVDQQQDELSADYDEDGFFLSDGPNDNRRSYRRNRGDSFVVFPGY